MKTRLTLLACLLTSVLAGSANAQDGRLLNIGAGVLQIVGGSLNSSSNVKNQRTGALLNNIGDGLNSISHGLYKANGPRPFYGPQPMPMPMVQQHTYSVQTIHPTLSSDRFHPTDARLPAGTLQWVSCSANAGHAKHASPRHYPTRGL